MHTPRVFDALVSRSSIPADLPGLTREDLRAALVESGAMGERRGADAGGADLALDSQARRRPISRP